MHVIRRSLSSANTLACRTEMMTLDKSIILKLHEALFPGEEFDGKYRELATRLRDVANTLQELGPIRPSGDQSQSRPIPPRKTVDFNAYLQRHVALEIMYLGHDYHGFARQESVASTIEEFLFAALRKTCLIPPKASWSDLNYSRGGRTDKGVSALGQVVALLVRSAGRADSDPLDEEDELDYPALLNRVLPSTIRVLGWTTVHANFSARFSACYREYKYFVVTNDDFDIDRMRVAGGLLVGEHDFRNFCKPDVVAVKSFVRRILDVRIEEFPLVKASGRKVIELYVKGSAFLWHQVRCIASVLLMVGSGKEEPKIVTSLLDLENTPRKPQYSMASEEPLLLYNCAYENLEFRRSERVYRDVKKSLDKMIER